MAAALSARVNKNDRNDAQGIAWMLRAGLVRPVALKSERAQEVQVLMGSRRQLVQTGRNLANSVRGQLKGIGIRLRGALSHAKLAEEAAPHLSALPEVARQAVRSLLDALSAVAKQIAALDDLVMKEAKQDADCKLLMSIPGVGAITAMTYTAALDDPSRFAKSRDVGAYMGLTPRQYASGEVNRLGHVSRCGPKECRHMLYEAAQVLLTRCKQPSRLRNWGLKLAKKKGMRKAIVAVARKLATLMHAMLVSGNTFQPQGI